MSDKKQYKSSSGQNSGTGEHKTQSDTGENKNYSDKTNQSGKNKQ